MRDLHGISANKDSKRSVTFPFNFFCFILCWHDLRCRTISNKDWQKVFTSCKRTLMIITGSTEQPTDRVPHTEVNLQFLFSEPDFSFLKTRLSMQSGILMQGNTSYNICTQSIFYHFSNNSWYNNIIFVY